MGSKLPNCVQSPACTPGVRRNASSWNPSWNVSSSNPGAEGSSRLAWGRPAVVPLPSLAEIGEVQGGPDRVCLDAEEVNVTLQKFETALVGRLFGKRIPFAYLNKELQRRWQGFGPFRLVTVGADSFICFFNTVEGRNAVLMGGPWVVAGQVVGVDRWSPDFSPSSKSGFITPIWVRFPELPFYCWGGRSLARIAGRLGEPIWMDAATDRMERGQFARVCIRMDLSQALIPGVWIDGPFGSFFQKTIYEGLPSFCFQCGHVGHKAPQCMDVGNDTLVGVKAGCETGQAVAKETCGEVEQGGRPVEVAVHAAKEGPNLDKVGEVHAKANCVEGFGLGPWMVVQRRKNRNKAPKGGAAPGNVTKPWGSAGGGPGSVFKGPAKQGKSDLGVGGARLRWAANIKDGDVAVEKEHDSPSHLEAGIFSGFKAMPSGGKVEPSMDSGGHVAGGPQNAAYVSRLKKRKHIFHHDGGVASPVVSQ